MTHRSDTQSARSSARKDQATTQQDGTRHVNSVAEMREAVNACRRCPLWRDATQGVPGEGPASAALMLVGETPGDAEDIAGHPFVGPAGSILNRALVEAGIDRKTVFVTNAVRHFKFERRGKRRLHSKPNNAEREACKWWLQEELRLVAPRLAVAMGSTAARSLLGKTVTIAKLRGSPLALSEKLQVIVTVHPSYLLRLREEAQRHSEYQRFVEDLRVAREWLETHSDSRTPRHRH